MTKTTQHEPSITCNRGKKEESVSHWIRTKRPRIRVVLRYAISIALRWTFRLFRIQWGIMMKHVLEIDFHEGHIGMFQLDTYYNNTYISMY